MCQLFPDFQVGVSLMLRTVAGAAAVPITEEAPQEAATAGTKDSGYQTTAAVRYLLLGLRRFRVMK